MANNEWGGIPIEEETVPAGTNTFGGVPVDEVAKEAEKIVSPRPESWSDVPLMALKNAPESAMKFGHDIIQPFIHPVETAAGLKNLGQGTLQHLGIMSGDEAKPYASAVGQYLVDRYGSMDNIKNSLATDPVGMAADVSMVLTGGGLAAARAPGLLGKVGEIAATAGRAVDPLTIAGKAVTTTGKGAAGLIGNLGTHTGTESVVASARSGYEGGKAAEAWRNNISGVDTTADVVADTQRAVSNIRQQRGAAYQQEMSKLGAGAYQILDFNKIDKAIANVENVQKFKGVELDAPTAGIRDKIKDLVETWKGYAPAQYHTLEGMDALKKSVGNIVYGTTDANTPQRKVGSQIYNGIRQTIIDANPKYGEIMKAYEKSEDLLRSLEKELSLTKKGNVDTALRKLQSVLRNNVNTNFGRRRELAQFLIDNGSPQLIEKLAGQAMRPAFARGWGRLTLQLGTEIALIAAGVVAHTGGAGLAALLPAAAMAPLMSPRLVGETAHALGQAARMIPKRRPLPEASLWAGRVSPYGNSSPWLFNPPQ